MSGVGPVAKQREQWLETVEETCTNALALLQHLYEFPQPLPPLPIMTAASSHQQKFQTMQQIKEERNRFERIQAILLRLKKVTDPVKISDILGKFELFEPKATCELKRCTVYARFWDLKIPDAVWLLIADYADDHSPHTRLRRFSVITDSRQFYPNHRVRKRSELLVRPRCWCSDSGGVVTFQLLERSWKIDVLRPESSLEYQLQGKHTLLSWKGDFDLCFSADLYHFLQAHKQWCLDQQWPGINNCCFQPSPLPQ